jgi:hypothetical protein
VTLAAVSQGQSLVDGVAKHATPFLVYEDDRRVPLYYLIHLTNNDLGMREMKDAMVAKSGEMPFWPVTLRDPAQLELDVGEQSPSRYRPTCAKPTQAER